MNDGPEESGLRPVEEIVPSRSVLTELARGFLLTREGDGRRANQFASTFLRERHAARVEAATESGPLAPTPTFARRYLGRLPHGGIDRNSGFPLR